MMKKIIEYSKLMILIGSVLVGIQLPSLVNNYKNALNSHFLESQSTLNSYQKDADKFFNGNLNDLISYYRSSKDRVFSSGGETIVNLYNRYNNLKKYNDILKKDNIKTYWIILKNPFPEIRHEVIVNYDYKITLTPRAIATGLVIGFIIALFIEFILFICISFCKKFFFKYNNKLNITK